jgi:hypothetical protein
MRDDDLIRTMFGDAAPEAAEIVLADKVGWPRSDVVADPAGAILALKQRLPSTGRIRKKSDRLAVMAATWIFDRIQANHPDRAELQNWLAEVTDRVS